MKGSDYFIFGLTFITGMFAGGYLYVTSFAPDYRSDELEELTDISFKLQGEMYGGCDLSGMCSTFTLESNRSFVLDIYDGQTSEEVTVIEGKLDTDEFKELMSVAEKNNWDNIQKSVKRSCHSYTDGTDYRYLLTYDGKQIPLDTCGMKFGNSEVSAVFAGLWSKMEHTQKEIFMKDGIGGFLQDYLKKSFGSSVN